MFFRQEMGQPWGLCRPGPRSVGPSAVGGTARQAGRGLHRGIATTRDLDAHVEAGQGLELPSHGPPFARHVVKHGAAPVSPRLALQFAGQADRCADQLSTFSIVYRSTGAPI